MQTDFYANIYIGPYCNLKCPYCFANPLPPPRQWPAEIGERLGQLERFVCSTGRWTLEFSGGEPTIYPGFSSLCSRLAVAGHQVMLYSNGVTCLPELFPGKSIRAISRGTFSYHVAHEKNPQLGKIFAANLDFLHENGVPARVNYVLYPDRLEEPSAVKARFEQKGVEFRFRAFQGKYAGRDYPYAYSAEEKKSFAVYGDIQSRFLVEHGDYMSTFKLCRAGSESFYIAMHTGGVYLCEQLQQREIVNFTQKDAVAEFAAARHKGPVACPSKRCLCRFTMEQEEFLATHDPFDMGNYPAWEELSLPTPAASEYWERLEADFVRELSGRLSAGSICLWGGGVHSVALLRTLRRCDFSMERLQAIIDSNPLQHGRTLAGLPIVSQDWLNGIEAGGCGNIVISSRSFEAEIRQQISELYGNRFNVICLYDGSMKHKFETVSS